MTQQDRAVIRSCRDEDVGGVVALIEERIADEDAAEARLVLEDASFDRERWTVAVDGGRVVSTMASFAADLEVGAAAMPASMIEFVATATDAEGRGLVRRQFDHHHRLCSERGELVQFIVGIPYFYRRLGYEMAIPMLGYRIVPASGVPALPAGWTVRDATVDDTTGIMELQRDCAAPADVRLHATRQMRAWYLASPTHRVRVAEHEGAIGAVWRVYDEDGPLLHDLSATGPDAVAAALHDSADGGGLAVVPRVATAGWLEPYGSMGPATYAYYVRIGDPVAFLEAMRPELEARLADVGKDEGELLVSLYTSSLTVRWDDGRITDVTPGPRVQAPISAGGSGIPPDTFVALALGPLTVAELDARHPDLLPGEPAELLACLFPGRTSDIASWVPP